MAKEMWLVFVYDSATNSRAGSEVAQDADNPCIQFKQPELNLGDHTEMTNCAWQLFPIGEFLSAEICHDWPPAPTPFVLEL